MEGHKFRPLPLLRNPHVQTILATYLNDLQPGLASRQVQVTLPDGDRLLLFDTKPRNWIPGKPMILMVHGLSGSHRSGYLARLGRLLLPHGWRVVRMDLRGAGKSVRLARRTYNAACSDDVRLAAEEVQCWSSHSPLVLVGYSLGGNIVLKLAGETANQALPNLAAVVAVNPPIDLEECNKMLSRVENRIYDHFFARALCKQVLRHRAFFPDLPPLSFPRKMTLRQFDDLYTAPLGGFADAIDYYRRASALPVVRRITVPTLVLMARDDPFIAVEPIAALATLPNFEVRLTDHGGHLGFLGLNGQGGIHWAEHQLAKWLVRTVNE